VDGDKFGDTALTQMGPNGLELRAVRQGLAHLDGWVGCRVGPLGDQRAVLQSSDHLPLHKTTLVKALGSVLPDDVLLLSDQLPQEASASGLQRPRR
jgi:hypothetical protein